MLPLDSFLKCLVPIGAILTLGILLFIFVKLLGKHPSINTFIIRAIKTSLFIPVFILVVLFRIAIRAFLPFAAGLCIGAFFGALFGSVRIGGIAGGIIGGGLGLYIGIKNLTEPLPQTDSIDSTGGYH